MGCGLPREGDAGPRELPPVSEFAGDDGAADEGLAVVLADYETGRADVGDVVAALAGTRVLVPVLAHEAPPPAAEGAPAARAEREAETAVVAVRAPDGRTALPVFTSVAALTAWSARKETSPA